MPRNTKNSLSSSVSAPISNRFLPEIAQISAAEQMDDRLLPKIASEKRETYFLPAISSLYVGEPQRGAIPRMGAGAKKKTGTEKLVLNKRSDNEVALVLAEKRLEDRVTLKHYRRLDQTRVITAEELLGVIPSELAAGAGQRSSKPLLPPLQKPGYRLSKKIELKASSEAWGIQEARQQMLQHTDGARAFDRSSVVEAATVIQPKPRDIMEERQRNLNHKRSKENVTEFSPRIKNPLTGNYNTREQRRTVMQKGRQLIFSAGPVPGTPAPISSVPVMVPTSIALGSSIPVQISIEFRLQPAIELSDRTVLFSLMENQQSKTKACGVLQALACQDNTLLERLLRGQVIKNKHKKGSKSR